MFGWRGRAQVGSPGSGAVARERLRLILVHDRAGCSPELLQALKDEMVTAVSRYLDVDRDGIEIRLVSGERHAVLSASIPVRAVRRAAVSP
ncbi:MAG: cell division topological specificity factor MinE [Firmicutes bacterium]|nr:cell division topological specificity factor MinE [Bacillota bacterium]